MYKLPYNGRAPLLVSAPMKRTLRFAAVFAAAAMAAGALSGAAFAQERPDPFTVKDLVINETSTVSPQDAITQGRAKAKVEGARRLIERLTLPEDRNAASPPLSATDVAAMGTSVRTQVQDKRSSTAAGYNLQSIVAQSYSPERVRQYLESRRVAYVDSQAGKALLVPSVAGGVNPNDWSAQWTEQVPAAAGQAATVKGREDLTVLTPYVASTQVWTRRPTFTDVQAELGASRANHAIVAEAYAQGGQIYARIIDLRTGAPDTSGNVIGPYSGLAAARDGVIAELERAWKAQSIVRTSGSSSVQAVASFRDLGEWVKIRKGLEGSRLVSAINIDSISQSGADVSFSYAGRPDQLAADLRSRGVSFSGADGGWMLQVLQ
jgi:hypothetical protein